MMKTFYPGVILVLLAIIIYLRACDRSGPCLPTYEMKTDTIVKRDTVWLSVKDSSITYTPRIKSSGSIDLSKIKGPIFPGEVQYDLSCGGKFGVVTGQYIPDSTVGTFWKGRFEKGLQYPFNEYVDTLKTQYGPIFITDTLIFNRIYNRRWRSEQTLPIITVEETVTKTVVEKPRTKVYAGLDLVGNQNILVNEYGPSLMVITPKDKVYEIGALYNSKGQWGAKISTKFLLFSVKQRSK